MLTSVISGPDFLKQMEYIDPFVDCFELRLDQLSITVQEAADLRKRFKKPMIFTFKEDLSQIGPFLELKPEFIDLDRNISHSVDCTRIASYHNFNTNKLEVIPSGFIDKVAIMAESTLDALKLLLLLKNRTTPLIPLAMGPLGQVSRILGPLFGSPISYGYVDRPNAPGQLSIYELHTKYRYHKLSSKTAIYGLIGDPVSQSISDVTHNRYFEAQGIDAVYVKMVVKKEELEEFFSLIRQLDFKGLSVTMPLKELVLPYLDEIDQEAKAIGAVNTIHHVDGKLIGYNTDGLGALDVLEAKMKVLGKHIVIIGAGGSAKAIAYEATKRGAKVTIVNRTLTKAKEMGYNYSKAPPPHDILINTAPIPVPNEWIQEEAHLMDININHTTGLEMFLGQAHYQFKIWIGIIHKLQAP